MAAFEAVSRLTFRPHGRKSFFDFRSVRLPEVPPDNDYNPRDHRQPECPISIWMAYYNLVRTAFGAGVLSMPLAISQAGIVLGSVIILCTGFSFIHMHLTLLNCLNEVSRQLNIPYISYRYGFRLALLHGPPVLRRMGERGPVIITTFMIMNQLGICTVYVCFSCDSVRDLMDWKASRPAVFILLLPYLILVFFLKRLNIISYVSLMGNFLTLSGLIIVLYHTISDPCGETMVFANSPVALLSSLGPILFNLSALGVIITLDKALKNPTVLVKKYGVITIGLTLPTIISIVIGILGYWSFGTLDDNIVRSLPYDEASSMVAIVLYLLSMAFTFPIQCYPAIQVMLETFQNHNPIEPPSEETMKLIEKIVRPGFVIASFILCYLVPFTGPYVAFVGIFCTIQLSFVFPAVMELGLMYPGPYGKWNIYLIKDTAIILCGVVVSFSGMILNVYHTYMLLISMYSPNR